MRCLQCVAGVTPLGGVLGRGERTEEEPTLEVPCCADALPRCPCLQPKTKWSAQEESALVTGVKR